MIGATAVSLEGLVADTIATFELLGMLCDRFLPVEELVTSFVATLS